MEEFLKEGIFVNSMLKNEIDEKKKLCKNKFDLDFSVISLDSPSCRKPKCTFKSFRCTVTNCFREYTSIDALALHIKRKHEQWFIENGVSRKVLAQFRLTNGSTKHSPEENSTVSVSNEEYLLAHSLSSTNSVEFINLDGFKNTSKMKQKKLDNLLPENTTSEQNSLSYFEL